MRTLAVARPLFLYVVCVVACSSSSSSPPSPTPDGGASDAHHATDAAGSDARGRDASREGSMARDATRSDGPLADAPRHPADGDLSDAGTPDAVALADGATPGLTKVMTGEYAMHFLVDGHIYAFGSSLYEGITASGIPATPIDADAGTFVDGQSGLHQSLGVDATGHVWTWGDNTNGQSGNGKADAGPPIFPFRIARDSAGNDFGDVILASAGVEVNGAIKRDGTVWIWGDCTGGLSGDGTMGGDVLYPTKIAIPLPSGVKATRFLLGDIGLVLASDGSVWAWGGGGNTYLTGTGSANLSPARLSLPTDIVDIALGGSVAYALTRDGALYGWGYYGLKLGRGEWDPKNPSCLGDPAATPVLLTASTEAGPAALPLPHPIRRVAASANVAHVVLDDGTLWGWGDDAMGEVGDGHELDFATYHAPYAWDFGQCELPVLKPVQIAKDVASPFTDVWMNAPLAFYTYARTADGQLYSWGRNKGDILGNGVTAPNSHQAAQYPNSWDVTSPTPVSPFKITQPTLVPSPYCVSFPDAGSCLCPNGTAQGC